MKTEIFNLHKKFSLGEKAIFFIVFFGFIFSGYFLLNKVLNENFLIEVPQRGGVLREGLIGTPRYINPVIAVSDTDKDLTALIYSGLTRMDSSRQIVTDLSEKYEVSEDGLSYTFYLKDGLKFHDGTKITADDVVFTIEAIQNPEIKSLKRSNWEGIQVEKIDDLTVKFTLAEPYPPFLENTTIGILPKHLWQDISPNEFSLSIFNTEPVGSGPYQLEKINKNNIGISESYFLKAFKNFSLGEPFIKKLQLFFVKNEEELLGLFNEKKIDSLHGIMPKNARSLELSGIPVRSFDLPRIFAVFFNQNTSTALSNKEVRRALNLVTPKNEIINEVLFGYANLIENPFPNENLVPKENIDKIAEAQKILEDDGWKKNEEGIYIKEKDGDLQMLAFNITTSNIPELSESAQKIAEAWNKIGANVSVKILDSGDFTQSAIRTRDFDAVLFGMIVARNSDLYAFWHSSQRIDPGLNLSGYTNITTDAILEKLRSETNQEEILELLEEFNEEIQEDIPAVFLYTPKFIYILPKNIFGIEINKLVTADERFLNVYKWYLETDKVLKIFNN